MDVISQRRSIRKFKNDSIPKEIILEILESARLAPSGANRQPWRFILVKNQATKKELKEACFNQGFVEEAPLVIVCCADINSYRYENVQKRVEELISLKALEKETIAWFQDGKNSDTQSLISKFLLSAYLNTTIAIEHLVLAAANRGIGTCWIQKMEADKIQNILSLPNNILVVAVLPLGYPAQEPAPRPRLKLEEIVIDYDNVL